MESLNLQVEMLSAKVDALHEVMDRISRQLEGGIVSSKAGSNVDAALEEGRAILGSSLTPKLDMAMMHKDVLVDSDYFEGYRGEQVLSPEVQIQRLTAQLTAAYNRIAALEEQLISNRIAH
jgi:hypothetical protein